LFGKESTQILSACKTTVKGKTGANCGVAKIYVRLLSRLMEMIHMKLYEEESKGLDDPRGYIQDGPRAVT
jgi:hypothetical protein